jgi:TatD DNase family protein
MISLIDTHTHLEEIEDLKDAISRAERSGIFAIIAVGSNHESNKRTLEISGRYGNTTVYPALGIHPWNLKVSQLDSAISFIEENIQRAVAIGEIGLDFWLKEVRRDSSKKGLQREVFKTLLDLSKRYEKAAIIHARGAWEECLEMTIEARVSKGVFHWYSGSLEILDKVLSSGFFISATPAAAYSREHQAAISKTPLESLLLETDSPVAYQGKKSEPVDVFKTLDEVARIKDIGKEQVAKTTNENALKFFELESNQ